MKLFTGFLTLFVALIISGVAAYFSVAGLAAIFAATLLPVVIMGVSLEAGKLVAAAWLHENWHNPKVNFFHKTYMTTAVVILMVITSMGVFGFLAKGHTEQAAEKAPVMLQIAQKEARLEQLNTQIVNLTGRQSQLDTAVNSIIADNASGGLRARRQQTSERSEITRGVEAANAEINAITSELVPLKLEMSAAETKLGPIKFAAAAAGIKDPEVVVMWFITLLVSVFDPLAVILVISGIISITAGLEERRQRKLVVSPTEGAFVVEDEDEDEEVQTEEVQTEEVQTEEAADPFGFTGEDESFQDKKSKAEAAYLAALAEEAEREAAETEVPNEKANLMLELEDTLQPKLDDETALLDILERRPELLRNVIDAVQEEPESNNATSVDKVNTANAWMDDLNIPTR